MRRRGPRQCRSANARSPRQRSTRFLRIDTVHQGDSPEGKGIYHINAVDEVTQWELRWPAPRISELG